MSDREFGRAVSDWLEDGSDRTPSRAMNGVLLAVKTTPQERDLRIPWRIPQMPVLNRAVGIAALALVVLVGAGGLAYLTGGTPGGVGGQPALPTGSPAPTPAPSTSPTPAPSFVAPGITGWTPYTSSVYGYTMAYPKGWEASAATQEWQPSNGSDADFTSDMFVTPDNELGVAVRAMPAGKSADLESVDGLSAAAATLCYNIGLSGCDTIADRAEPMCLDAGGDPCRAAILVRSENKNPEDEMELAFFPDWTSLMFTNAPDKVIVVAVGRGDGFPGAAPYGGSVQLLKSILSTMGVTTTVGSSG